MFLFFGSCDSFLPKYFCHFLLHSYKCVLKSRFFNLCNSTLLYLISRSFLISVFMLQVSTESVSLSCRCDSIFHITGLTEESVVSFSLHRASVKVLSGPRTSCTVSSVVMSVSVGIRHHLFLFSAKAAQMACCCSQKRPTISNVEPQRVGSS